jgi:hypothetical protein
MIYVKFSRPELFANKPKLVFNIHDKGIHVMKLEKPKNSMIYGNITLIFNTNDDNIGDINYNLGENLLVWMEGWIPNSIYVSPIDKRLLKFE